jgi:hypothetical protein
MHKWICIENIKIMADLALADAYLSLAFAGMVTEVYYIIKSNPVFERDEPAKEIIILFCSILICRLE